MKVKIQQRSVYHKFAEVEIEVDKDEFEHYKLENGKFTTLLDFLQDRCFIYDTKIDEAMSKAEYVFGSGSNDYKGMDDESDSEWRFECDELKTGGHL